MLVTFGYVNKQKVQKEVDLIAGSIIRSEFASSYTQIKTLDF